MQAETPLQKAREESRALLRNARERCRRRKFEAREVMKQALRQCRSDLKAAKEEAAELVKVAKRMARKRPAKRKAKRKATRKVKARSSSKPAKRQTVGARLLAKFDQLNARQGGRYYVTLYDLREALPGVSRDEFDAALNALRRDWVLTLTVAEGRHETVPAHVLDAGILEGGKRLVYVARRES